VARPVAVTAVAARTEGGDEEQVQRIERARKADGARFGAVFGLTVHRALELVLSGACDDADAAVSIAAREQELTANQAEAAADVRRALATLAAEGLDAAGGEWITEYPVAAPLASGELASGFIDLLHVGSDEVRVIDFKTDTPAEGEVGKAFPAYARQLDLYVRMLRDPRIAGGRRVRSGLLFTATGELRWHTPREQAGGGE
jgi:ATP-dependent exoDNAse (exonuclease V) beta subunit